MKRVYLILAVLVALGIVAAALGLRRVPNGYEAVRTLDGGSFTVLDAGWHFVGPGKHLVRYPVGRREYRVPDPVTGQSFPVIFQNGASVLVAFDAVLDIPAGSAGTLFETFSANFEEGVQRLVVAAAETEAAANAAPPDPGVFTGGLRAEIDRQLAPFGITLAELRVVRFGDRTFQTTAASDTGARARRLVIVGVDGGDWLNLRPLIDAGKLPNFARLVKEGATGPLRSEEPMLSPLLWTTMATGRYPEQHGILNFTVTDPKTGVRVPISRLYRRVDAFWNMLGDYNRTVAIIGWLATDPAEAVDGLMVTDKFGYLAYAPADTTRAAVTSVYPPSRDDELSKLVVHGESVPAADILKFLDLTPQQLAKHRGAFDPKDPVNALIHLYASTMSFKNIALHELEQERPDVLAVYFEWVDAMSHLFMLHTPPRMSDVPEDEYKAYHGAVEQAYITQDKILGDIMDAMGDDAVLMVLSDHGFKSGESRLHNRPEIWAGNAAKWHRIDGIIGFYGKGVKRGYALQGASIMDVAPTVLALTGLPRAQDMPGKVLADAFQEDVSGTFSTESVATLDKPRASTATAAAGSADEETMKKLEALGYLAPDNADAQNNLGQRYQQRGEYQKAVDAYKEAIRMRPNFYAAYNNLAVCYGKLKMYDQAEDALEKCIALKPDDFYAMNNLAVMCMHTGRVEEGTHYAEQSVKMEPGYANGRVTLGSVYAMQKRFDEAEQQFREALRLDPDNEAARINLDKLAAARKAR